MSVNPVPEGFHTITPYLTIDGASDAIDFYKKAFGAEEIFRLEMPGGLIGHAQIKIGHSQLFLADACDEGGLKSPRKLAGSTVGLHLYVEDIDSFFLTAIEAGGEEIEPVKDQFYGDRRGALKDPFGHLWWVASCKEVLSPEQINERAKDLYG